MTRLEYFLAVIGDTTPRDYVAERRWSTATTPPEGRRRLVDEDLAEAESMALGQCRTDEQRAALQAACDVYHEMTVSELVGALEARLAEGGVS